MNVPNVHHSTTYKSFLLWGMLYFFCFLLSYFLFAFLHVQDDTSSFVQALELAFGESQTPDRLYRWSKPLALVTPSFLHLFGVPFLVGLLLQQAVSWWLAIYFFGKINFVLFQDKKQAYLAALLLLLCQPMAVYGLAGLVDMLGWAYILGVVYWVMRLPQSASHRSWIQLGILLGLGFFIKESSLIVGLFVFFFLAFQPTTIRVKLRQYLIIGSTFTTVIAFGSWLTWHLFGQTVYHWVLFNEQQPPATNWYYVAQQSYRTLDVFWLLIVLGIVHWQRQRRALSYLWSPLLATGLVAWLVFPFLWHYHYDRILFMNALFLLPLAILGSQWLGRLQLPYIVVGGLANLLVAFGIYRYQIGGLIVYEFLCFLGLLIFAAALQYKKKC